MFAKERHARECVNVSQVKGAPQAPRKHVRGSRPSAISRCDEIRSSSQASGVGGRPKTLARAEVAFLARAEVTFLPRALVRWYICFTHSHYPRANPGTHGKPRISNDNSIGIQAHSLCLLIATGNTVHMSVGTLAWHVALVCHFR
jgi:hypothetical protein